MLSILHGMAFAMIPMTNFFSQAQELTVADKFDIFTAMNLHQIYIDLNQTCLNAKLYAGLYWPDASFRVVDPNRDSKVRIWQLQLYSRIITNDLCYRFRCMEMWESGESSTPPTPSSH